MHSLTGVKEAIASCAEFQPFQANQKEPQSSGSIGHHKCISVRDFPSFFFFFDGDVLLRSVSDTWGVFGPMQCIFTEVVHERHE